MQIYNTSVANFAASIANSILEIASGATRSLLLLEIDAEGDGTTSAYMEAGLFRVSAIGTGTAQTAAPGVPIDQPNMTGTTPALALSAVVGTGAWGTTQATLAANPVHRFAVNANGQRYFWRCNPNLNNAIVIPGGGSIAGTLSCRFSTMPAAASLRLQLAEM